MNVFGFFAVIIICATIIGAIWFLNKFPITIKTIKSTDEAPKTIEVVKPTVEDKPEEESEVLQKASMDAVIRAANELMGIETEVEDDR